MQGQPALDMTSQDVMRIGCRLVAVYLLAGAVWAIAQRVVWIFDAPPEAIPDWIGLALTVGVFALVIVGIPVLLWLLAPRIARFAERRVALARIPSDLTEHAILLVGIVLIGVMFSTYGVADVIGAVAEYVGILLFQSDIRDADVYALRGLIRDAAGGTATLLIGLVLMMGPHAVIGFAGRLRRFGLETESLGPPPNRSDHDGTKPQ